MAPDIIITLTWPYREPIRLDVATARELQMQLNGLFSPVVEQNRGKLSLRSFTPEETAALDAYKSDPVVQAVERLDKQKATLDKESPDGCATNCVKDDLKYIKCYCNDCYSESFRSHI